MTTTIDRAEISRRNGSKSKGPSSARGKSRSRFNAVKHGCRARLPILPGEDPDAYQRRLDAWIGKFQPGDDVELYLVERAVHVSWQLDRADRAEAARLAATTDAAAVQLARDVEELATALFRVPGGSIRYYPAQVGAADAALVSMPIEPEHPRHPSRLVAALEASALGCRWLLDQWKVLGDLLDEGRLWQAPDRLRAIRLVGRQPLELVTSEQVMTIYLACQSMDPEGPDLFAEALSELCYPEMEASQQRFAEECETARAERTPKDSDAGRAELRAMVEAAVARLEPLRAARAADEATVAATPSAPLNFDPSPSGEWLRKHQGTCSRTLFRTFEALRKLRRDFGEVMPADEGSAEPPAANPCADRAPAARPHEIDSEREALARWLARPAPASSPCEVAEPIALSPTVPDSIAVLPAGNRDSRNVTNEPSDPCASGPSEAEPDDDARNATTEAGVPAEHPPVLTDRGPATMDHSLGGTAAPARPPTANRANLDADAPSASPPPEAEPDDSNT